MHLNELGQRVIVDNSRAHWHCLTEPEVQKLVDHLMYQYRL